MATPAAEQTVFTGTDYEITIEDAFVSLKSGLDVFFLLFAGTVVFFMQAGFAMLCAGCVRSKNAMNILLKNVLDACVGAMGFYLFGYGFAYGIKDGKKYTGERFIGNWNFALSDTTEFSKNTDGSGWIGFFFQWAFAAAAATIVSGAVAERCSFVSYMLYSFFLTSFVYPVVVHWVWNGNGWLTAFDYDGQDIEGIGAIDFAGSGVVHMTGGVAALAGAAIIGPRIGRFDTNGKVNEMKGHSVTLVVLGTFILWVGWYGFNPGSQLAIGGALDGEIAARSAVTTTLSAAAGGFTALFASYLLTHTWDLPEVCNGVLAGLVGITAGCPVVQPWAALIAGMGGALSYMGAQKLLLKLKIDDVVGAFGVHGAAGAWGVIFVGFLAFEPYVIQEYGTADKKGVFYGGDGSILACQIVEVISIFAWVGTMMGLFFFANKMLGILRVPMEVELAGLDVSKHGGTAYNNEEMPLKK